MSLQTEDEDGGPSSQDLSLIFTSLVLRGKDEPEPTDGLLFRAEPALVSPNCSLDMNQRLHDKTKVVQAVKGNEIVLAGNRLPDFIFLLHFILTRPRILELHEYTKATSLI